jgi:hypothetical protein
MRTMMDPHLDKAKSGTGWRIVIVRRPHDDFEEIPYLIQLLIEKWRNWGFNVVVTSDIGATVGPNTIVIPHVDSTQTPPEYWRFFNRCDLVLNRSVTDISKRKISRNLLKKPIDYDGPVIVKTNLNCAGQPEMTRVFKKGSMGRAAFVMFRRLPWELSGMVGTYKVFDHPRLVPWVAWRNPLLVVEKFQPELRDGLYCLRQYTFFGRQEINTLLMSREPIVKTTNVVMREVLAEPWPGIREIRKKLGFDYGKFDYVVQSGNVVLFDVNRTPTYSPAKKSTTVGEAAARLSEGIYGFIE